MTFRQVILAAFVSYCLVFETLALASLYQVADLGQDGETQFLSGNLLPWNQGFTDYVYNRSSETFNVTASTAETASQRSDRYGEAKAIFEVFEDVNKAMDNDTILRIAYQHGNINPNTSSIQFFVWAKNETHQFRIHYVIGYIEQDFLKGGIYFIFHGIDMDSRNIYVRPWETLVNLNIIGNALQIIKYGVKLTDYYWEGPNTLSLSVTIDLTKSYLFTYYDRALPLALNHYKIELIQSSVIICAAFLLTLSLILLLRKRMKLG